MYKNDLGLRCYKVSIDEGEPMANSTDVLENQEFYELMQQYRLVPFQEQSKVVSAYDAVKDFIRSHFELKEDDNRRTALGIHVISAACYKAGIDEGGPPPSANNEEDDELLRIPCSRCGKLTTFDVTYGDLCYRCCRCDNE